MHKSSDESTRPYRSGRRAVTARATRNRIIAAAVTVLSAGEGRGRFSLEAVAQTAGVTRLTVYNQFGSRRALLESAFDMLAAQGGLHRIRDAMTDRDPHAGLQHLVAIFCEFWSTHGAASRRLLDAAVPDPELKESLHARNERRRQALSVLVARMTRAGGVAEHARVDLVDVLFTLTSVDVFVALKTGRRSTRRVCRLIQTLAAAAVREAKEAWD